MSSALIGLALIVLIAVVTVALGTVSRLLAARVVTPRELAEEPLSPLERIGLGNEIIARDLQPDDTHPVARTAEPGSGPVPVGRSLPSQDLAVRYPEIAAHALR